MALRLLQRPTCPFLRRSSGWEEPPQGAEEGPVGRVGSRSEVPEAQALSSPPSSLSLLFALVPVSKLMPSSRKG